MIRRKRASAQLKALLGEVYARSARHVQAGQHAIDQRKQALTPDPGPLLYPVSGL